MTDRQASEDLSWIKNGNLCAEEVRRQYDQWAASYDETLAAWGYTAPDDVAKRLRSVLPADAAVMVARVASLMAPASCSTRTSVFTWQLPAS